MGKARRKAREIIKKFKTRNPLEIAEALGIEVYFKKYPMGVKGYFSRIKNRKIIVVNSNYCEAIQKIILAHELGHALLHRSFIQYSAEKDFFPCGSPFELEANRFTAELLLSDDWETEGAKDIECVPIDILKSLMYYKIAKLNKRSMSIYNLFSHIGNRQILGEIQVQEI